METVKRKEGEKSARAARWRVVVAGGRRSPDPAASQTGRGDRSETGSSLSLSLSATRGSRKEKKGEGGELEGAVAISPVSGGRRPA